MFGIDVLNSVPISHLLMGESITFKATDFDREPSSGYEGKYATVNWLPSEGVYQVTVDGESTSTNYSDGRASMLTDFGQFIHGFRNYGVKFGSLSPSDSTGTEVAIIGDGTIEEETEGGTGGGTAKDCSLENREAVAGDTTTCGSCLSGYVEDETGVCVAVASGTDETEIVSNDSSSKKILGALAVFGTIGSVMVYMANKA